MSDTALICPECGARNTPDDDFCGECGAYLAWDQATDGAAGGTARELPPDFFDDEPPVAGPERAEDESEPEVPVVDGRTESPVEAPQEAKVSLVPAGPPETAPRTAPGGEDRPATREPASEPEVPPADAGTEPAVDDAPAGVPPVEDARSEEPPDEDAARTPASPDPQRAEAAQPAPVPPAEARQPAASQPAAAPRKPQRPQVRAEDAPKPGDVVCPTCGAGNAPGRNYCRRCATQLTATQNRSLDPSAQPKAGARPVAKRSRVRPAFVVVPILLLVLLGVGWLSRDWLASAAASVIDKVAASTPVRPVSVAASSSADGRGPELAFDGFSNTSWAPGPAGAGAGEFLEATFAKPFRLVYLQMIPGASSKPADFLADGRPDTMLLTMTLADGSTVEKTVTVADKPGNQQFDVGIDDVSAVRFTIGTGHGVTDATRVAVAEVEFRSR
ncbi:zinc ribbon domain-containing protein [Leifsonia sp. Leaf264]|uniref:zinc ribbon domain-containing protein n=1 Tax=Leifsonia sp. Leaf264 TaxID=1736314 RepID=UPI0007019986|nr:zinc ribbon domain-containing protein [Leifsonia sp. Leaf264]KQO96754.1 hypothetical protein ASF30_16795 [Leifsonia sp. Leaf264]